MNLLRKKIKRWIRDCGYELRKLGQGDLDEASRISLICERLAISLLVDVGANRGQFAVDLRMGGFKGRILSFEPLIEAHTLLLKQAARDPNWTVAKRMALGRSSGEQAINVSQNSFSSSFLPMMDSHLRVAPSSAYKHSELIAVRRLDDVLNELGVSATETLALKVDTQGYEAEVLAGASGVLPQIKLIFTELSLTPLYAGAPTFDEMYSWFRHAGFRCVGLSHEFSDDRTGEMLQVNGLFLKD